MESLVDHTDIAGCIHRVGAAFERERARYATAMRATRVIFLFEEGRLSGTGATDARRVLRECLLSLEIPPGNAPGGRLARLSVADVIDTSGSMLDQIERWRGFWEAIRRRNPGRAKDWHDKMSEQDVEDNSRFLDTDDTRRMVSAIALSGTSEEAADGAAHLLHSDSIRHNYDIRVAALEFVNSERFSDGWVPRCMHCGDAGESLRACASCKTALFCGRECQKAEWRRHKAYCRRANSN
jgi:hypothetical protein